MNSRNKLIRKLAVQMMAVIAIIGLAFYFLAATQTTQMQQRLVDKANLFSQILGTNLDKIVIDNLLAYKELQEATALIIKTESQVESLRVIGPEYVILTDSSGKKVWQPLEEEYKHLVEEVIKTKGERSIVKTAMDKELVVHFMPIYSQGGLDELIGVVQVTAAFPSQQGNVALSLRTNKSAYFRKEASAFSSRLAASLDDFMVKAQINFKHLEGLIQNVLSDSEIEDVKVFCQEAGVLFSGTSGRGREFIIGSQEPLYKEAMQKRKTLLSAIGGSSDLLEVVSPLYLGSGQGKKVGGAVGITLSLSNVKALALSSRNNILGMSLLIVLAFTLLIGLFFRRNVLAPITDLISLTQRIAKGDFSRRSRPYDSYEFTRLARAFNEMSDELERSKKEIQEFNLSLQERVDDISGQLKEKQAQLLKSEKLASLGVLSSGIAHEINNPLGIILGHTQMLLRDFKKVKGLKNAKEAEKLLEDVEANTKRCSHIVSSLLHFARKKELKLQDTDITQVLDNALMFTQSRLSQKGVKVTKDIGSSLPTILADPIQLEQVFINLILNAEQSIADTGTIVITAGIEDTKQKDKTLTVSFEDDGRGIAEKDLRNIFDPFFSTKEPGEGAGLGLSVSYGIIKAHGGDIQIKSKEGKGTKAIVSLPLKGLN